MSQVVGEDLMVGMGYIGLDSGRLYRMRRGPKLIEAVASGTTVIINDATEGRPFRGLRVFGKSTQVRTTGAQLLPEQAVSNYFISLNGDIVGKNNSDYSKIIQNTENTTYYIFRKNVGTRFRAAYVDAIPTGNTPCTGVVDDTKDNISITVPAGKVLIINMEDTKAFDGLMVQKTRDRLPYEPYTGGKPSPSPEYPQEIVNAGEGGSITVEVTGRNLLKPNSYNTYYEFPLKANTVITLMTNGKPSQGGNIKFSATDGSNVWFSIDAGQTRVCRSIGNKDVKGFYDQLKVGGGLEYMFAVGDIKTYTPYVEPQSLTLQTPNGLPGVPVSKDGNYTDQNGQQWVCDEIDLGRGKYVQRVNNFVLNDKTPFSVDIGAKHENSILINISVTDASNFNTLGANSMLCDRLKACEWNIYSIDEVSCGYTGEANYLRVRLPISAGTEIEEIKNYLADKSFKILYIIATPIERDLTPEEIAAYKALRTYGPTTVVSNDAGAEMEITYRKDKKNEKIHWNKVD